MKAWWFFIFIAWVFIILTLLFGDRPGGIVLALIPSVISASVLASQIMWSFSKRRQQP